MRSFPFVLSALALVTAASGAVAQEADSPAKALFKQGRALSIEGDHLAACNKFEQSLALEAGVGTQFNLADCWEHLGRYASAQAMFLKAAAEAKASGQADREQVLRDRAAALAPLINKLVIEVKETDPKLVVKRDETAIEADQLGKPIGVDPGKYVISASAPNKLAWSETVWVKAKPEVVTVVVPELKSEAAAAGKKKGKSKAKAMVAAAEPPPAEKPEPIAEQAPPPKPAPAPEPGRSDRFPDYKVLGLAGLGVGALTLGTVMAFRYKSANDDAKQICPTSTNCSDSEINEHQRLVDRASTARTFTYVGFIGGVACLSGAAVLYLLDPPKKKTSSAKVEAVPVLGPGGFYGTVVTGAF